MKILSITILLISIFSTSLAQKYRLILDPGHGGKDPGTEKRCVTCQNEKEIVLEVALLLGKLIEKNYDNLEVIYTRKDDYFVSLDERVKLANQTEADMFLSLHCNANPNRSIEGFQIHIHDHSFVKSKIFGEFLEKALLKKTQKSSRGIFNFKDRESHLYVLQYTKMPSVLVEMGFLSHPEEEKFLNSSAGKQKIVEALLEGIENFCAKNDILLKNTPKNFYKIQITASDKPIPLDHHFFKKLDITVVEHKIEKSTNLPYKYTVGKAEKIEDLNQLIKEVREKGFHDAFISVFSE